MATCCRHAISPQVPLGRGQSMVEFALIAPVLIGILLALLQGGILIAQRSALNFAVRQGVRTAAVHGTDDGPAPLPRANDEICQTIRTALASAGAAPDNLTTVTIFRANANDSGLTTPPTDNTQAHDIGTCAADGWHYKTPWDVTTLSYSPGKRTIVVPTDQIGLTLTYAFKFVVPIFGSVLTLSDSDILKMEPQYAQGSNGLSAPTVAPTYTYVPWPTSTCYPTATNYATLTPVATPLPSATPWPTATLIPSATPSAIATVAGAATTTRTPSPAATYTPTPTMSPTGTATLPPTATTPATATASPTSTPGGC